MFSSYSDCDHNNVGTKQTIIRNNIRKEETASIASFPESQPEDCTAMTLDDNSGFYWG